MTSLHRYLVPALLAFLISSSWSARLSAHTPLMSVLVLEERVAGQFITSFERTEGITDPAAAYDLLKPVFPEHCRFEPPRLDCAEQGLSGRLGFDGLADLSTSGTIKIRRANGTSQALTLTSAQPHVRLSDSVPQAKTPAWAANFVWIGVTHILLGVDHLLFVLGLLWLLDSWRALLKAVTAFTVGHSLTLGAATLGWTNVPSAPVEAVIALSIAFVAVELARERRRAESLLRRSPWLVALVFGLLHGFGFANALAELEVADAELPIALLGFNAGVELGQLAFIAFVLALRPALHALQRRVGVRLAPIGYYAMGGVAMYWFFERVSAFGSG